MEQNDRPEALDWTKALDKAGARRSAAKRPAPLPEPSRRPAPQHGLCGPVGSFPLPPGRRRLVMAGPSTSLPLSHRLAEHLRLPPGLLSIA